MLIIIILLSLASLAVLTQEWVQGKTIINVRIYVFCMLK